jgi:acyl-coenzyme A synthetase/AMP-(fatty) acid ligase
MVGGWLNTGDTYRQDEDGYFIYDGRSDDMLKVGGIWCSPVEVESCLITHPAVLEAAVVGHADENSLISPRPRGAKRRAAAGQPPQRNCGGLKTWRHKYPRWVSTWLPKTATGELRFKLRSWRFQVLCRHQGTGSRRERGTMKIRLFGTATLRPHWLLPRRR